MNGSAGAIGGIFIHERHAHGDFPKLFGWWGQRPQTRFRMDNGRLATAQLCNIVTESDKMTRYITVTCV